MSRIGKKPIEVPGGIEVDLRGRTVTVKGARGALAYEHRREVQVEWNRQERRLTVRPTRNDKRTKAYWGLTRALLANMVRGVSEGFSKRLQIIGTGYSAQLQKQKDKDVLVLNLGFCHPVRMEVPDGLEVRLQGTQWIEIKGAEKQKVGQFAADIRRLRPRNVYTGKGVCYEGEEMKLKPGKAFTGGA